MKNHLSARLLLALFGALWIAADARAAELATPVAGDGAAPTPAASAVEPPISEGAEADGRPALRYRLSGGADRWDPAIRERIVRAMDEAVALYNGLGVFDKVVTANYSAGTPTADANYDGWINFGGQINTRVALHEIGHTLGVGTHRDWGKHLDGRTWTGTHALSQLRAFDGPDAVLKGDRMHFWPYGLNYDNEDGPEQRRRHVLLVAALRRDLGIANDAIEGKK